MGGSGSDSGTGIALRTVSCCAGPTTFTIPLDAYIVGSTNSNWFAGGRRICNLDDCSSNGNAFVIALDQFGRATSWNGLDGLEGLIGSTGRAIAYADAGLYSIYSKGSLYIAGVSGVPVKGSHDAFVAKLSADDLRVRYYVQYLHGSDAAANGIAARRLDSDNPYWPAPVAVYVTGSTRPSAAFEVNDPIQGFAGGKDAFVVELRDTPTARPSIAYSTLLGGAGDDLGNAIAVDAKGNMYITGYTLSKDFPLKDPWLTFNNGFEDAFVSKIGRFPLVVELGGFGGIDLGRVQTIDGSISCPGLCSNDLDLGKVVTLTIKPTVIGPPFDHWAGDCSGTLPSCTVNMTSGHRVQAVFKNSSTVR
jgi:hypothetical protein